MSIESMNRKVVDSNAHRKHFDKTPEELAKHIVEEAQELVFEIQEALITSNAFSVAGEIGDLYILLAQLCEDLGIRPEDAMKMKVMRNQYKYPDYMMNNGDKAEAITMSKKFYEKVIGGDQAFSHAYLDILSEE